MRVFFSSLLFLVIATAPLAAGEFDSAYTKIELDKCQVIAEDRESGSIAWRCVGYQGTDLYVAEGDIRFFVSAGSQADQRMAASQTLPAFNRIHDVLEWRLDNGQPFATILRYFIAVNDAGDEEQLLVVSKLGTDNSCHMAYVNASRNQNANILARDAADTLAREFICGKDDVVIIGVE